MKKIALLFAAAIAVAVAGSLVSAPAQATTWTNPPSGSFRVIEANIGDGAECMSVIGDDCTGVVNQRIAAYSPDVVAMSEVCYSTYLEFRNDHPTWKVYYAVSREHKGPPTADPTSSHHCAQNPVTGEYESKGEVLAGPDLGPRVDHAILADTPATLLCAPITQGASSPTRACVAHLVSSAALEPDRVRELRTIQNLKDGVIPGSTPWGRPYIAGDFNSNHNSTYWSKFLGDTMLYSDVAPNAAANNNPGPGVYTMMDPQTANFLDHNLFRVKAGMATSARTWALPLSTHSLQEAWVQY